MDLFDSLRRALDDVEAPRGLDCLFQRPRILVQFIQEHLLEFGSLQRIDVRIVSMLRRSR